MCKREFYGEQCFQAHLVETMEEVWKKDRETLEHQLGEQLTPVMNLKSTCTDFQRCTKCMATYKVNRELPHKCLHAQCRHCLDYVNVYEHKCFITSEEEKHFKRILQKMKKEKKKREQLIGNIEGLSDELMERLIVQRKRKLKMVERINKGVSPADIQREDLQEQVMAQLLEEGLCPEEITPEMVNARLPHEQTTEIIHVDDLIFADIECLLDSTNTFIPILICYTRGREETIYHHRGTDCISHFLETVHQ